MIPLLRYLRAPDGLGGPRGWIYGFTHFERYCFVRMSGPSSEGAGKHC